MKIIYVRFYFKTVIRGLMMMACLIEYFKHAGSYRLPLLKSCASCIYFPPLITSMQRIIEDNHVINRDIITFCSTFFTFIRAFIPSSVNDSQVLEYSLQMCNLISNLDQNEYPLEYLESRSIYRKFFLKLGLGPSIYFWKPDFLNFSFPYVQFKRKTIDEFDFSLKECYQFSPKTFEYSFKTSPLIMKEKHMYYLGIIDSKTKIFNLMTGKTVEMNYIKENIEQIVMINLDESKTMDLSLDGQHLTSLTAYRRIDFACQFLTEFMNHIYFFDPFTIHGLISFNNKSVIRCPFMSSIKNFKKMLNNNRPQSTRNIWDSLAKSCDEIIKFRNDPQGNNMYVNATSRIIIISDGDDEGSSTKLVDIVQKLLDNRIVVDSVIINSQDVGKMLCVVSYITGGLSFHPKDLNEGIALFGKEWFYDYKKRNRTLTPPDHLKTDQITEEFMHKALKFTKFTNQTSIKFDMKVQFGYKISKLSAPQFLFQRYHENDYQEYLKIFREVKLASEINDISSKKYNPDIKIFIYNENIGFWKVYIKGPEGTPYENKWWEIVVIISEHSSELPNFRFISIPFHPNVTIDGLINLNAIEGFHKMHIVNIIEEIRKLLISPNLNFSVRTTTLSKRQFEILAKESSEKNAKYDYNDYIKNCDITYNVQSRHYQKERDYSWRYTDGIIWRNEPKFIIEALNKSYHLIYSSTYVNYSEQELIEILEKNNKNPICIFTGIPLKEKLEHFVNFDSGHDSDYYSDSDIYYD